MDSILQRYREDFMRTMPDLDLESQLLHGVLGLAGEVGELTDMVKKEVYQGHDIDEEKAFSELGDIVWHLFEVMDVFDITLEEIMELNIQKRLHRYPDGFSEEASRNRVN